MNSYFDFFHMFSVMVIWVFLLLHLVWFANNLCMQKQIKLSPYRRKEEIQPTSKFNTICFSFWLICTPYIIPDDKYKLTQSVAWVCPFIVRYVVFSIFSIISPMYPCPVYPESVELSPVSGKTWPQNTHSIEAELTQGTSWLICLMSPLIIVLWLPCQCVFILYFPE